MSIVVNNNISSLIAQRNLSVNTQSLQTSIERLSSGYRINNAADDAAGLSISEGLRSQIRGNSQAINNIQDGINLLQIAEGGLDVINENIQRIRELCVQAANDTNATTEKQAILDEIGQRLEDITRIAKAAKFNDITLLDGASPTTVLQIGADAALSTNTIDIQPALPDSKATSLGINISVTADVWTGSMIRSYLGVVDTALTGLMRQRSLLGAYQNRLESGLKNLQIMNENVKSSESRIRDLDIAKETAQMTKSQILQQASVSVLAQANQIPQLALSLLR